MEMKTSYIYMWTHRMGEIELNDDSWANVIQVDLFVIQGWNMDENIWED